MTMRVSAQDDSEFSYGESVNLQTGMWGSTYHAFMRLCSYDGKDTICHYDLIFVVLSASDRYYEFPENSRMLIKFQDDKVFDLDNFGDITKVYENLGWNSTLKKYVEVYKAGRHYILNEEVLTKLLNEKIAKVRIELANGNFRDFEIEDKHAKKIQRTLAESYKSVLAAQKKRLENINDIHNNF